MEAVLPHAKDLTRSHLWGEGWGEGLEKSAAKRLNGANKNFSALVHGAQVNPFFHGMGSGAVGAEDDCRYARLGEEGGIHPKALTDHFRALPQDLPRLAAESLDNGSILADAEGRPNEGSLLLCGKA